MDDRKTSISLHDLFGRDGADAASIAPGVRRSTEFEDKLVGPNPDQVERLERFRAKWVPVRVKRTRQIKNLEPRFDPIETEKALAAEPPRESAQIVYCGTEQQVREGFAIALRAMGIETDFLPGTWRLPPINPNKEDN